MSNGTEKCQICYFSFNSAELMVNHLREYLNNDDHLHKSATYRCNLCGNECFGGEKFVFHMDTQHFAQQGTSQNTDLSDADRSLRRIKKYKCSDCEKTFPRPADLIRHIRTHDDQKPFQCQKCKVRFRNKHHLKNHSKTHNAPSVRDQLKCDVCRQSFLSASALKLHFRKHTGESPFECEHEKCDQKFRTKKLMLTHYKAAHLDRSKTIKPDDPETQNLISRTLRSMKEIEFTHLVPSQNSAFSSLSQHLGSNNCAIPTEYVNTLYRREMVVIRVQLRSGSAVHGTSNNANLPTNIVMDLSYLAEMAKLSSLMQIPLKRLTLQLSLSLSVDPGAVLHRLQKSSSSNLPRSETSTTACFNHVVYPTAQHVISRPPLPFSVITNRRDEDGLNTGNMPLPSFLIECFLAPQQSYDPQGRQSCLPMLYNVDGNGDYV